MCFQYPVVQRMRMALKMYKNKKMHLQSVQNYCFSLLNMHTCDILVAPVVITVASAPYSLW